MAAAKKRKASATKGKSTPIDKHVGMKLRLFRSLRNLTQQSLAEALGITFQQLQKYENGTNRISASKLYMLSSALEVNVADFFEGYYDGNKKAPLGYSSDVKEMFAVIAVWQGIKDDALKKKMLQLLRSFVEASK